MSTHDSSKPVSCLMILKNEMLLGAVARGELPTVRRLLDRHRADVNTHNPSGMSCLQIAIVGRHHKLADYLIQKGVDLHSADSQGWNALHDAALMDSPGMVRKLIAKGVSPMCTTHLSELPIDLAGSVQMENLLCEEMCEKGETSLARQYYVYFGLDQLNQAAQTSSHQPSHFNRNISNGAIRGASAAARAQKHGAKSHSSSNGHGNGSTRSSRDERANSSKKVRFPTNPITDSGSHITTRSNVDNKSLQASGEFCLAMPGSPKLKEAVIDHTPPCESTHAKNGPDINSLYQHTGFQFEIGLSLQQRSTQFTAIDSELPQHTSECSIVSASYPPPRTVQQTCFDGSPAPRRIRTQSQVTPPLARINSSILRRHSPRAPRRTVSFNELPPMTRKKTSFDGSRRAATGSDVKKASGDSSTLEELSAELISQLNEIYDDSVNSSKDQFDSGDEASPSEDAIALLKMKPRKPSIVSPARRKSSEMRRRSVTFPPEVLLQVMVTDGDSKGVCEMLESGAVSDVNVMSPAGLTALHQSAVDGNLEVAKALVGNGAKINCVDCEKWTPLHAAVVQGHVEFVRFLLQAGANPAMKNEEGDTPYNIAKHKAIRKMLLHAMNGKSLDADDFSDGEYSGEEEEEYSHAESDSEDDEGGSGLFDSSSENKPSLKERLGLNHSAALKNTHDNSVSPSPDYESSDSVFISEPAVSPVSPKERTINDSTSSYGSLNEPETENIKEKSLSTKDKNDHKPTSNSAEDVGYSDTDKISEDQGISTMDGSSDCSHRSRILSEDEGTSRDGIDKDLIPGSVNYKFQEACLKCDVDTLLKLTKYNSDIDVDRVNDTSGITALHHAVLEENPAFVQHLVVDFGANVHAQDRDGWTPLHAASAVGNIRIAQFLLDNGAKASVLNKSCEFPVDVAEDKAMEKLLKNVMLGSNFKAAFTR